MGDGKTSLIDVILTGLASYRIAKMISTEYGPGDVFLHFRSKVGVYDLGKDGRPLTFWGKLFECPLCFGVWLALALMLIPDCGLKRLFVRWMSIAGLQTFLQSIT